MTTPPRWNPLRLLVPALLLVAVGSAVYLAVVLFFGMDALVDAVTHIGVVVFAAAIAISFLSYGFRFAKWDVSLRALGTPVPRWINLRVYLSGLALTASPGKLGETVRGFALIPYGVPLEKSLASFFVDRLTDVAGVALAGFVASAVLGHANGLMLPFVAGVFVVIVLIEPLLRLKRFAGSARLAGLRQGLEHIKALWTWKRVPAFILLSVVAYGAQGLIFVWFCDRAGISLSLLDGLNLFCSATLLGAASLVPGGLGAMEASLVFQLVERGYEAATAVSVTVAFRFVTLWMGIGLGALALLSLRKLKKEGETTQ